MRRGDLSGRVLQNIGVSALQDAGATANAGENSFRQLALRLKNLPPGLFADDAVEVADHGGIRMRAEDAAEQIVGGADVGDPVAHGLVDGVFEGARAGVNGADFGSEEPHAEDVELLAPYVFGAHVNDALDAEEGTDGGGGHAVLSGSGFGDDAVLTHAAREQGLSDTVVDLVRAGVEEVFALEVDLGALQGLGETFGIEQWSGAASVGMEKSHIFGAE